MNKNLLSSLMIFLCLITNINNAHSANQPPAYAPAAGPEARGPGDIMLSPKEMEELQAMEQLVEQERAKMDPHQRAEFDNTVAELTRELEKMQPEELDAFISQVIFGQDPNAVPGEEPTPQYPQAPQPAMTCDVPQESSPIVDETNQKQDELLTAINGIIASSKSFLEKINTAPATEWNTTLKKWADQKKIKHWKATSSWDAIKKQIEALIKKLDTIKAKDDKTHEYIYLNDILQDTDLFNTLCKFHKVLQENEHTVEIDPVGFESISKESKQSLMAIINGYLETFGVHNLLVALENILTAHKASEEDLSSEALAKEDAALNITEVKAPSRKMSHEQSPKLKPQEVKVAAKEEPKNEDPAIMRLINKLEGSLEGAADNIKSSVLQNIKGHLLDSKDPNPNGDAATNYLPNTIKKLKTATGNVKALKVNVQNLPTDDQATYRDSLKAIYEKHKNSFDEIVQQTKWIKTHESLVSAEKKYAFLGGPAVKSAKDISHPSNLYELQKAIEEFASEYKTI